MALDGIGTTVFNYQLLTSLGPLTFGLEQDFISTFDRRASGYNSVRGCKRAVTRRKSQDTFYLIPFMVPDTGLSVPLEETQRKGFTTMTREIRRYAWTRTTMERERELQGLRATRSHTSE